MNRKPTASNVHRKSTLASLGLTVVLLLIFLSGTFLSQPTSGDPPSGHGQIPGDAMLRMLLASERRAEDFIRNPDCQPPIEWNLDESRLNRLIIMGYLQRLITAEGAFSDVLLSYPSRDRDGDGFTALPKDMGATFRGKDCDDRDPEAHPMLGGSPLPASPVGSEHDHNCNGIWGVDPVSGSTYEDEYCASFKSDRGILVFGDSWASGFGMDATCLEGDFRSCMTPGAETIYNYPEESVLTGYTGPSSLYLEVFRRNRCAHRQWMNFATPDAKMEDFIHQLDRYDLPPDKPRIVVVQFAMGDVCADSVAEMTDPAVFETQLNTALNELDTRIGNGSRVLLMGLSEGKQYDLMKNQFHPVGGNATYAQVYDYLSCVGLNPCPTYFTTDAEVRNAAALRSKELDFILEQASFRNYNYFSTVYIDTDHMINNALFELPPAQWTEFFNDFDGIHPSLDVGASLMSQALIEFVETHFSHWIGVRNPNNAEIESRFGDQGGY